MKGEKKTQQIYFALKTKAKLAWQTAESSK